MGFISKTFSTIKKTLSKFARSPTEDVKGTISPKTQFSAAEVESAGLTAATQATGQTGRRRGGGGGARATTTPTEVGGGRVTPTPTITTRELAPETQEPVRSIDVAGERGERIGGFTLFGAAGFTEPTQVIIKEEKGRVRFIPETKIEAPLETEGQEAFKESILGRTERFLQEDVSLSKGVEKFLDISEVIGEKVGVGKLVEKGILPDIKVKKSTAIGIGTDISKFILFAPTFATTADIAKSFSSERLIFAGKQQKVGDVLVTKVRFTTMEGRKGIVGGITKSKIVGEEGQEFIVSRTIGFGKEFRRGIQFPTGKIVEKPTGSFIGFEKGVGKQLDSRFLEAVVGKVKVFKKPRFKGKEKIIGFRGFGAGVTKDEFSLVATVTKSDVGQTISAGFIKRLPEKDFISSLVISPGKPITQIVGKRVLSQVQNIAKAAVQKPPTPPIKARIETGVSSQVSKEINKVLSPDIQVAQITKVKVRPREKIEPKEISGIILRQPQKEMQLPRQKQVSSAVLKQEDLLAQVPRLGSALKQQPRQKQKLALRFRQEQVLKQPRTSIFTFPRFRFPTTPKFPIPLLPLFGQVGGRKRKKGERGFKFTPSLGVVLGRELGLDIKGLGEGFRTQTGLFERQFKRVKLPTVI